MFCQRLKCSLRASYIPYSDLSDSPPAYFLSTAQSPALPKEYSSRSRLQEAVYPSFTNNLSIFKSQSFLSALFFFAIFFLIAIPKTAQSAPDTAKGPGSAVTMLQKAIDESDYSLMEKHLDVSEVIRRSATFAVEKLEQDPELRKMAQKSPVLRFAAMSIGTKGAPEAVTALLFHETESFIRYGVNSGAFAGKPEHERKPGNPGLLFADRKSVV